MKNLIYVFAVVVMGLVACGAPAEKSTVTEETTVVTTDTMEVVTEEVEMEMEMEMDSTATIEETAE